MSSRRKVKKGSFAAHLDELVKQFPQESRASREKMASRRDDPEAQQEKRSIHALLFERAWEMERGKGRPD